MDKVTIYRVLWSTLKLDATNRHGLADVITLEDHRRALDVEREKVKVLEQEGIQLFEWRLALHSLTPGGSEFCTPEACESWVRKSRASQHEHIIEQIKQRKELQAQLAALQAQLARWKEALGEWLWNCTNLLGDYHIKTVQDFNEEVNRRIAWLMQHLDYTLPPPMTDEERDRMRKLSEDNAALQADNECKDSLIETLQAQLVAEQQRADRAVKDRSDVLDVKTKEGLSCSEWLMRTAIAERKAKDLEAQLRHVEGERDALKLVNETHMKTVMKLSSIVEKSATLAQDAGKEGVIECLRSG